MPQHRNHTDAWLALLAWFDQELTSEPDFLAYSRRDGRTWPSDPVLVSYRYCRSIDTFSTAPEDIISTAKLLGQFHGFLYLAAANANTSALQLVEAPCMNRGLLNMLAVPHKSWTPVFVGALSSSSDAIQDLVGFTQAFPSGAMSRSCQA